MIEASAGGPTRMKEQLSWGTVKMWKTVEKHYRVFIVVSILGGSVCVAASDW